MSGSHDESGAFEVKCPHCGRSFEAELLEGPAERYSGFKCPHCKLFVPYERADDVRPSAA